MIGPSRADRVAYSGAVRPAEDPGELRVGLDNHLPATLPVGRATAIFCFGHCFARHQRVADLELLLDGVAHRPLATAMPRRDLYDSLAGGPADPEGRSYRSGFWATLPVPAASAPRTLALEAAVTLAGAAATTVGLGSIRIAKPQQPDWRGSPIDDATIAVCMATFEPDLALFEVQIESLLAQSDPRWVCAISDDGTSEERFAAMVSMVSGDPRFVVSRAPARAGPYLNFERALQTAPARARLLALCDQDDRWYPDKLATLRDALGSASLVYSDQRLVDRDHRVLRQSLWEGRRNDHRNLASMLVANSVPGAAMLFTREVADLALPFPEPPGFPFHDHWLALVALATGEIAYVDAPLYDYVQHLDAVSGDLVARPRAGRAQRGWRAAYFAGYLGRKLQAQTLLLRCGPLLTARKRRALQWFIGADHRPARFAWLAGRSLRRLIGRDETLGGEIPLVEGIIWRWLIRLASMPARIPARGRADASFPDPPLYEQPRLRRWRAGAGR